MRYTILALAMVSTLVLGGGEVRSQLKPSPAWQVAGSQAGERLGHSVASAGDVNMDGYDDVIVGAINWDNGNTDEGRAMVYHGTSTGLSATPAWTKEGDAHQINFGWAVASAGDVDMDGYDDIIVGARNFTNDLIFEGAAWVFMGSPSGVSMTAAWMIEGDQANARFGYRVASAGDVNMDGYDDVIVGTPFWDATAETEDEGRAWIYHGSVTGLSSTPARVLSVSQAEAAFGAAVASAGDVNMDGYDDVIVGADLYDNGVGEDNEGRAYVYLGSAGGVSMTPNWFTESNDIGARLGNSVASAGDVNMDGYDDVIVGAYGFGVFPDQEGRAWVFLGSASGVQGTENWSVQHFQPISFYGFSVASAGDTNGDGYDEVMVGAYFYGDVQSAEGIVYIHAGSPTGVPVPHTWSYEPNVSSAGLGNSVAPAGDVNMDGFDDVVIGASGFGGGRAYLFLGCACPTDPDLDRWNLPPATLACQRQNNCYDYAADLKTYTFSQPGLAHGMLYTHPPTCTGVSAAAQIDGLKPIDDPANCPDAECPVALVVAESPPNPAGLIDYHWYRLNEDGSWSHKPGETRATTLDTSQNPITDPQTADRRFRTGVATFEPGYADFCGFFCVPRGQISIQGVRTPPTAPGSAAPLLSETVSAAILFFSGVENPAWNFTDPAEIDQLRTRIDAATPTTDPGWSSAPGLSGFSLAPVGAVAAFPDGVTVFEGVMEVSSGGTVEYRTDTMNLEAYLEQRAIDQGFGYLLGIESPGRIPASLTVEKQGTDLNLRWQASCLAAAEDYAIFEGQIGSWYSHSALTCSDSGPSLRETITPTGGDRYYLVVPITGEAEGSYGQDSASVERPVGSSACAAARVIVECTP